MNAPVYYWFAPEIRVDTPFAAIDGTGWDGDVQAIHRDRHPVENLPGQLWERVAESQS